MIGLSMIGLTLLSPSTTTSNGKTFAAYHDVTTNTFQFSNFFPKFANTLSHFHFSNSNNDNDSNDNDDDDDNDVTTKETQVYQDEYDQTKIITKTIFPLHFFNNDSSSCDDSSTGTSSSSSSSTVTASGGGGGIHLPQEAYYDHNLLFADKDSIYYLNETDYNFLLNITTQIGSFDPLPSSTTTTTQPLAMMVGANGNVNVNLNANVNVNVNTFSFGFNNNPTNNANNHPKLRKMIKPKRFIPVLEARGSSDRDIDKNEHGHRRDTIPIATAIDSYSHNIDNNNNNNNNHNNNNEEEVKVHSAVFQFLEEDNGRNLYAIQSNLALKEYLRNVAHGVVVRINPGTLSPLSQKKCDDMLRELSKENGLVILSHPDVSSTLGAKDVSYYDSS